MPTSSTAKLIAKQQKKHAERLQQSPTHQPRIFNRYVQRRPKSCKYDSYRLRSRISAVDESLFGEPLKNKLMARSKSMEALAQDQDDQTQPQPDRLFVRRQPLPQHQRPAPQERPRTALATMRTGKAKEPEFQSQHIQVISRDNIRSLIVPQNRERPIQPLILTRREFEKILKASKVLSASERAAIRQKQVEEAEAAARESQTRREQLEAAASAHAASVKDSEAEKETRERNNYILEKAQMLKDESMPEVKKLNQLISEIKCQAIRDVQVSEKQRQLEEMAEADRHLEEAIEAERIKAIQMAQVRARQLKEFQDNYKLGLKEQKAEQEALKLLEDEQRQYELKLRQDMEDRMREAEMREKEVQRERAQEMKQQMMMELEEAKVRKAMAEQALKREEERILKLQDDRRKAEIAKEEEEKAKKKAAEDEKLRILDQIERDKKVDNRREEIRMLRQQEAQDRKWREAELRKAQSKAEQERQVHEIRAEQLRQKKERAAKSMAREKELWEMTQKEWQEAMASEAEVSTKKHKKKREYLRELQQQMESNQLKMAKDHPLPGSTDNSKTLHQQERLDRIRERKIQQLKAYNVPERYLREIEKKWQQMGGARFTLSYFGKK